MWKEINGYDGYYEINECGEIRSLERIIEKSNGVKQHCKPHIVRQFTDKDGYKKVKLNKNGQTKIFPVHRLIAFSFVPGYEDNLEVNHIDFNRENNCYTNLEWVTHSVNVAYTKKYKRHISDRDLTGANNPNFGNHTLKKRFQSEENLSLIQSRPGAENGRARAICAHFGDKNEMDFKYIGACAKYIIDNGYTRSKDINNVSTHIRIAADRLKPYYGIYFKFI